MQLNNYPIHDLHKHQNFHHRKKEEGGPVHCGNLISLRSVEKITENQMLQNIVTTIREILDFILSILTLTKLTSERTGNRHICVKK